MKLLNIIKLFEQIKAPLSLEIFYLLSSVSQLLLSKVLGWEDYLFHGHSLVVKSQGSGIRPSVLNPGFSAHYLDDHGQIT